MTQPRRTWPRRTRLAVQAVSFAAFLAFIACAGRLTSLGVRGDSLMRLSPFCALGVCLAARTVAVVMWPALAMLVGGAMFGRWFCGWHCPLGAAIDVVDKATGLVRRRRKPEATAASDFRAPPARQAKYWLLAACLLLAALGVSAFGYVDPLSMSVRASLGGWAAAGVVVVLAMGLFGRRFWCRTICPLGALHGAVGRRALTARKVSDACIHCGKCARVCPTRCISPDGTRTLAGECTLCLDCQAVCPVDAIRFLPRKQDQQAPVDLSRRGALAALGAVAVTWPAFRLLRRKAPAPILPPLAGRDEQGFLAKCLRCGQCMRVCPQHILKPTGLERGLEPLWTPVVGLDPGYCDYECDQCGKACPSGAIPRFTLAQKHAAAMGTAVTDYDVCIQCMQCVAACPVPGKAIEFGPDVSPAGVEGWFPHVLPERCVGCGRCQATCPAEPRVAIRVVGGWRALTKGASSEQ